MNKMLVFDMDGTIANFYGVNGWLTYLDNRDTTPYDIAKPMYNMEILARLLEVFKACGWTIVVTTWLAGNSTKDFDNAIRQAKKAWLAKYDFPYDEIHLVKYGTTKADCTREKGGYQILIDDNEKVRKGWHLGETIDANNNILTALTELLKAEVA